MHSWYTWCYVWKKSILFDRPCIHLRAWLFHGSVSDMMTPRSLSALVTPRRTSFMWYMLDTGLCLRVICCTLHLDSLNNRPAEDDQMARLLRSPCRSAASVGDLMDFTILVLSAKAATWLDLTVPGKEFAHRGDNMGLNMDPWGTHDVTGRAYEFAPNVAIICIRS